ncbi:MAG: hypothetical protein JWM85_1066 [Acidimicrobiaceae bacterium]|nr:hypothetical protein [Acidimicrobiaceae bacterium]
MGLTEIAELLNMTRQGADKLVRREPTFPEPTAILTGTRIWEREAVEGWALRTGRLPDERRTWWVTALTLPPGSPPTSKPLYLVHLLRANGSMTLCGLGVPEREIGCAGFATVDAPNRCPACQASETVPEKTGPR